MSLRRLLKHPVVKPFSTFVFSRVRNHFHLDEPNRMWLDYPELGFALLYDWSKSAHPSNYRALLETFIHNKNTRCLPLKNFKEAADPSAITFALRHDIDNDICAALTLAKIEHGLGLQGSYYVLHTAPYYGIQCNGRFERSRKCLDILLEIQSLGHEIGLHNDLLKPLLEQGIPVAETLGKELAYLRGAGLDITGTVSHGSYHTYLASNYEVFEGLAIDGRDYFTDNKGQRYPLNMIRLSDYGLAYEGNHILRSFMVSKAFYDQAHLGKFICPASESDWFERDYDAQYGIFGNDLWLKTDEKSANVQVLSEAEAIRQMLRHPPGSRIVIDSHPEYYGNSGSRKWIKQVRKYIVN